MISQRNYSYSRTKKRSLSKARIRNKSTLAESKSAKTIFGSPDPLYKRKINSVIQRKSEISALISKAKYPGRLF